MTLIEAKDKMISNPTEENGKAFGEALAEAVRGGEMLYMPSGGEAGDEGFQLEIRELRGNYFAVAFTDEEKAKNYQSKGYVKADINTLIDAVYSNPAITGIALDISEAPVFITRKQLTQMTDRKDPRLEIRNWGEGIPEYDEADLMVPQEVQDFAVEVVLNTVMGPEGYNIYEVNTGLGFAPNIVAEKDGKICLVMVDGAVYPAEPVLEDDRKEQFAGYCAASEFKALYAPVVIGACDKERFEKGLALIGDAFYAKSDELIELN